MRRPGERESSDEPQAIVYAVDMPAPPAIAVIQQRGEHHGRQDPLGRQLDGSEHNGRQKPAVVGTAHAVVEPHTVVIKVPHALLTEPAVLGLALDMEVAAVAVALLPEWSCTRLCARLGLASSRAVVAAREDAGVARVCRRRDRGRHGNAQGQDAIRGADAPEEVCRQARDDHHKGPRRKAAEREPGEELIPVGRPAKAVPPHGPTTRPLAWRWRKNGQLFTETSRPSRRRPAERRAHRTWEGSATQCAQFAHKALNRRRGRAVRSHSGPPRGGAPRRADGWRRRPRRRAWAPTSHRGGPWLA